MQQLVGDTELKSTAVFFQYIRLLSNYWKININWRGNILGDKESAYHYSFGNENMNDEKYILVKQRVFIAIIVMMISNIRQFDVNLIPRKDIPCV